MILDKFFLKYEGRGSQIDPYLLSPLNKKLTSKSPALLRLIKNTKNNSEKDFYKQKNNSIFGKTMENAKQHKNIKFVKTEKGMNHLVSEPNYQTTKAFSETLLVIEIKITKVLMN